MAWLKNLAAQDIDIRAAELLEQFHLTPYRDRAVRKLSGGTAQRLAITTVVIDKPKILLLDEPTTGLDPKHRALLRAQLQQWPEWTKIVISTHILGDIENTADRVVVMKNLHIISDQTMQDFLSRAAKNPDPALRPIEAAYLDATEK